MKIIRSGSLPSAQGPEAWFTGTVRIDAPFQATEPARVGGATVTFEPGARTAWQSGGSAEPGRYRLDPTRREALARGKRANGDDAHRHRRIGKRQPGSVAGKSHRRAVPERLTAKHGNRLLKARRALRQVIRGVGDVIHHPRIGVGHGADTGDGRVDER